MMIKSVNESETKKIKNIVRADIIIDTRETKPWEFNISLPSDFAINSILSKCLKFGDYSLSKPYDDLMIIERKASLEEFLRNIGKHWDNFQVKLLGLSKYKYKYIIIEDDLYKAYGKYKSETYKFFNFPPAFIIKRVSEIQVNYGISTYFMSNRTYAQQFTCNLFKYHLLNL